METMGACVEVFARIGPIRVGLFGLFGFVKDLAVSPISSELRCLSDATLWPEIC